MVSAYMLKKYRALVTLAKDSRRKYRDRYSLLYPHGIMRKVVKQYPQYTGIRVFVETGTFQGKTAQQESRYFRDVYTIELNEKLYYANLGKFKKETPNVKPYLGDSAEIMPDVLKDIKEPCVIFLDAHWSGNNKVDWAKSKWEGYGVETSYRGETWPPTAEQQCPLINEAAVIGNQFEYLCVLIIDDWDSVGTQDRGFEGEDWSSITLERILNALGEERIVQYFKSSYKEKVRMVILLS